MMLFNCCLEIIGATRVFCEKYGESGGRHCYAYCFGYSKPCEFCESFKPLKTGRSHHWQVKVPDGSIIDAYDFPFTDINGSNLILEMNIDVTEQKQVEEELRRLATVVTDSNDAITVQDFDGNIMAWNYGAKRMYGWSEKEALQMDILNTVPKSKRAEMNSFMKKIRVGEEIERCMETNKKRNISIKQFKHWKGLY